MNEKRYYWLKLEENYFDLKIQKALRKLPSGADMLICYLKMQLKYLNKSGLIEYQGIYEDLAQEIALDIDEEVDIVKMTLTVLIKWNVIEEENSNLYLAEMQGRIGSKTDVALRVAKHREKQKMLQCNNDVTKCNYIKEKEIELDKDIEIDKDVETTTNIYDYIENNFNRTLSPLEIQKIDEWLLLFNEEIIKYGVSIAVMNHKKTFSYVNGILKNWQGSGYTTLEEVKQESKEIKPSEKNKEIQELETYNWLEEGD